MTALKCPVCTEEFTPNRPYRGVIHIWCRNCRRRGGPRKIKPYLRDRICSLPGCKRTNIAIVHPEPICFMHYNRIRTHGDPEPFGDTERLDAVPLQRAVDPIVNSYRSAARVLKMDRREFSTFRAAKTLSVYQIDEICCAMGVHPYDIYGEDWLKNCG